MEQLNLSVEKTIGPACELGEGPLWHPLIERLFWFDIPKGMLYSCDEKGGTHTGWQFEEPASAAGWLDEHTLLVATASGLQKFNITTGLHETLASLEADNSITRSNDGRVGPDGSFWIGTMASDFTPAAGKYYRYANGEVTQIMDRVSIPNATCFSPDGRIAYLADTRKQVIWRWPLSKEGNPVGDREVHINLRDENINPDGAVCDVEGFLWNAQWGSARLARYAPDGTLDQIFELPVSQPTCPAFGGKDLKTLYVTSAKTGLSQEELDKQPDAGKIFVFNLNISGLPENQIRI